MTTDIL